MNSTNTNGEINSSTNRLKLKPHLSFPSRLSSSSSLGMLSQISEIETDDIASSPSEPKLGNGNSDARFYNPYGAWNDSPSFPETFKREVYKF